MQQWIWIVIGAAIVAGLVLMVIEGRIMRKPESERTEREKRFMTNDRRVGRANQRYQLRVAPWVCVGLVVIVLALLTPQLLAGHIGTYLTIAIPVVALGVGMVVLWAWARKHRGAEWRRAEDERNHDADVQGRPRWFISGKAGFWLGGGFLVLGVAFTVMAIDSHSHDVFGGPLVVLVGVVMLVLDRAVPRGTPWTPGRHGTAARSLTPTPRGPSGSDRRRGSGPPRPSCPSGSDGRRGSGPPRPSRPVRIGREGRVGAAPSLPSHRNAT